jgi:hypothetical protein
MNTLDLIDAGIPLPIFIRKIKNHSQIKNQVLDTLQGMGKFSNTIPGIQKISHTDFHLSPRMARPYFSIIEPILREHHTLLTDLLKIKETVILANYWFQQYELGDYHGIHVHDAPFSSVYYVDLPNTSPKTTFNLFGKEYHVDVEEGDILTFPGFIPHHSKENTEATKTIIAFNSTYEER